MGAAVGEHRGRKSDAEEGTWAHREMMTGASRTEVQQEARNLRLGEATQTQRQLTIWTSWRRRGLKEMLSRRTGIPSPTAILAQSGLELATVVMVVEVARGARCRLVGEATESLTATGRRYAEDAWLGRFHLLEFRRWRMVWRRNF